VRRLLLLGILTALAVMVAPGASASVTIGSTYQPRTVEVLEAGGIVTVRFVPPTSTTTKWWTAKVPDLRNGTYSSPRSTSVRGRFLTCRGATITSDATAPAPPGIPAAAIDASHSVTTRSCPLATGWTVYVQTWVQQAPDFGTQLETVPWNINVSAVRTNAPGLSAQSPNPADTPAMQFGTYALPTIGDVTFNGWPILQAESRWSKFSPGGYQGYLQGRHFEYLFGSFTYAGVGVWGPGDRGGNPTNQFGRNVYIDTWYADYGPGWRRVVGVLTQKPNGTYCYEFSPKGGSNGKTGVSKRGVYSVTVQGPGIAPDVRQYFTAPPFAFGNDVYNAKLDKWGTNFSDGQTQALRDQAAQMGPTFRRKVKGTDCAQTLRQLPESFYTPVG
jgi:hypothetical protein